MALEFATFDFETTGLKSHFDRVIEVGVVRTNSDGEVLAEFSSLINPHRDLGRTDIHGITAGLLMQAPVFGDVADEIVSILNGAVLVAHNASFDTRFLRAELARLGVTVPKIDALCTLELMYAGYPRGPRRLGDCCSALGIPMGEAHCALDDARMASHLLHHLLDRVDTHVFPEKFFIDDKFDSAAPALPRTSASNPRVTESLYLSSLVNRLPSNGDAGLSSASQVAQYLNFLDQVLDDRKIEMSEADALVELAEDLGLSSDRIAGLHAAYVANLCAIAKSDGVVTEIERSDLEQVSLLLNVSDWELLLESESVGASTQFASSRLSAGTSVCFTGEMSLPRASLASRAVSGGLEVKNNVSRKLDLLVVADTDSMSGKAQKAREAGVRIVTESVFLAMLDEIGV